MHPGPGLLQIVALYLTRPAQPLTAHDEAFTYFVGQDVHICLTLHGWRVATAEAGVLPSPPGDQFRRPRRALLRASTGNECEGVLHGPREATLLGWQDPWIAV